MGEKRGCGGKGKWKIEIGNWGFQPSAISGLLSATSAPLSALLCLRPSDS
jgi:hypothetical protein